MQSRISSQCGGQPWIEKAASVGGHKVDVTPGQQSAPRLGVIERVAEDLHREYGHGADHQAEYDNGRLPRPTHRLPQRQPGQKWPAYGEREEPGIDKDEQPDHNQGQVHRTARARSVLATSMRPSRMCSVRRARSATWGLWVTSTMVCPSLFMRTSSSTMTCVTSVSRFPVGSSAQTTAGL